MGPPLPPQLDPLWFDTKAVGTSYYRANLDAIMADAPTSYVFDGAIIDDGWKRLPVELTLRAEPRNRHDPRAVKVLFGRRQIGHVPHTDLDAVHAIFKRRQLRRGVAVPGLIHGSGETPYGVRYTLGALRQ